MPSDVTTMFDKLFVDPNYVPLSLFFSLGVTPRLLRVTLRRIFIPQKV